MSTLLMKHRFTVEQFHQMTQVGIFTEDDRVELVDGEVIEMTPIGSSHAACVKRLNHLFSRRVGDRALVSIQDPIRIDPHSEPQPDVALLRPRLDYYAPSHPKPQNVLLVIEVAETSAHVDREVKLPLYARAGIPEAWLVDLAQARIEVYREPTPQGYQLVQTVRRAEHLRPTALPDLEVAADEIFG